MILTDTQRIYLENLLQSSSVETLSPGIASALLHLHGLGPDELLTLSLIACALCIEHEEAGIVLSSQKKSDLQGAADIYTHCANTLVELSGTSSQPGNDVLEAVAPSFDNMTLDLEPPIT